MSKIKGPLALEKLGIKKKVNKDQKVVIKTHFGALENTRYLRPSYLRFLCDFIKEIDCLPYLAESCGCGLPESISGSHTEYSGRANQKEYLEVALKHGFTKETVGAPIIMLDGPKGIDFEIQKIKGKLFNEILVAGRLREFDHYDLNKCLYECDKCIRICPTGALTKNNDKILVKDWDKCRYCYMCRSICEKKVIDTGDASTEAFIIQMVDNAKGVVEYFGEDKLYYLNYAIDITWQCDCGSSDVPFVPDIGILSSLDPVALDQASIDLVHKSSIIPNSILSKVENISHEGSNEWFSYIPRFDPESGELDLNEEGKPSRNWEIQLKAAEEIGLGSRSYNLIEEKIDSN